MKKSSTVFKVGTRGSKLARIQTQGSLEYLAAWFPSVQFEEVVVSSPGDRDQQTDLRVSPPDFFTRDLDEALAQGRIDMAVHSAKDLPDPVPEGLDWCWLPWKEDPRDVLVFPMGQSADARPESPRVGVSSDRRVVYCQRRFPQGRLMPIRGTIEERLAQLDAGRYDVLIMAAAALVRLGIADRIGEWIPDIDLPPAEGQGALAMTFRAGDAFGMQVRQLLVKAVTFVGAGVGSAGLCTVAGLEAIRQAEVCLHDTLMDPALLDALPPQAQRVDVGKRSGRHGKVQLEINRLLARYARQGLRVVRLKGGDPGLFGRLAEEVETLDTLQLPYRVIPGVSSLTVATTGTGMLLTRRGVSRGFCALTPRAQGGGLEAPDSGARARLPIVLFMAIEVVDSVAADLIRDGLPPETPVCFVFDAGAPEEVLVQSTLGEGGMRLTAEQRQRAGLVIIGEPARYRYRTWGALEGRRVLVTTSAALQDKARQMVVDYGGRPIAFPLIRLSPCSDAAEILKRAPGYDWMVFSSPSAVECATTAVRQAGLDVRRWPRILAAGSGTASALRACCLIPEAMPETQLGAAGMVALARTRIAPGQRVLRLRSDKADGSLAEALRTLGAQVDDVVLYRNEPIRYDRQPDFESVFFASGSAVDAFVGPWGVAGLAGKTVVALGPPTVAALQRHGVAPAVVAPDARVEDAIRALAVHEVAMNTESEFRR